MSIFLYAILIFFLYNFVVKVLLPVYRTTRQIKRQFNNMQQQFQGTEGGKTTTESEDKQESPIKKKKQKIGEYIDFEEVK